MHQARAASDVHVAAKMSVLHDKTSAPAKRSDDGAFRCYRRRPKRCRAALATALQKFSEWPLPRGATLLPRPSFERNSRHFSI